MNRIETLAEGVTLYLGDCREIDLVVTSPPYAQQRQYISFSADNESLVGCLKDTPSHSGTQILINLGLIHKDGEVIEYWNPIVRDMRSASWRLFGWYVWDKIDGMAGNWAGRLAPSHEWIFHFNRNSRPVNKCWWSKWRGIDTTSGNTGLRRADGSMGGWSQVGKVVQELKIPDSVLRIYPERSNEYRAGEEGHPAIYPELLPQALIDAYSSPGELVLDPFVGSGTTGVAAISLGRKFIGIEIEEKYFDLACRRISDALKQPDMFIEPPKPIKQEALL